MRKLNEYQVKARELAFYPSKDSIDGLNYVVLGLAGEAGEVANNLKKHWRDDAPEEPTVAHLLTVERKEALVDEAGDCLWYVANLASELGMSLADLAKANIKKLEARHG